MIKQKKILIIDDEIDLCYLMESFFKKNNQLVAISHTLKVGMELMNSFLPDVLFLDNNLPDGTGWLQSNYFFEINPLLKLYLMSGYHSQIPNDIPGKDFTVLPKPISFTDLSKLNF
jgi:DNA-binding NtrC family response regulator